MKILLIDPPFYRILGFYNRYFPIGLTTIGTFLDHHGHDVAVYDADFNENPRHMDYSLLPEHYPHYLNSFSDSSSHIWAEIRRTIEAFQPDIVGITAWTTFVASSFYVAKISKETMPDCVVVMGGPHATVQPEEILKISPDVDYVIRGEGEYAMLQLTEQLSLRGADISSVPGVSFRHDAKVVHIRSVEDSKDLGVFPVPDRTLLMNEDKYTSEDMGLIMASRGCPFACSYCATHTRKVTYRSAESILDEMIQVKERYGTKQFSFKDDSFTVNHKKTEQLCDLLIEKRLNVNWECNTRVDLINESLLWKMKKAGCNSIKVGIETGSKRILEKMNKGITFDQVERAADLFRKVGIYWTGYFMMGVPGETKEEIHRTLDFMLQVRPDFASIGVYEPFPGTPMFAEAQSKQLVKSEMTLREYYSILPNHYYKVNTLRQIDTIPHEEFIQLTKSTKEEFHRYNTGIMRTLRRLQSRIGLDLGQPSLLYYDFVKYLRWR